jgi:hypothetical protein
LLSFRGETVKPINLVTVALGVLVLVIGHYLPDLQVVLSTVGGGLCGFGGLPRPSDMTARPSSDGGHSSPGVIFLLLFASLAAFLGAGLAHADVNSPLAGRVVAYEADGKTPRLSAHGSAVLPTLAVDLKTGTMAAGVDVVPLGLCYGLTYKPTAWYASGADVCVQARIAESPEPNQLGFALMLNLADYLSAGVGALGTQSSGRLVWHGMFYLSPRLPIQ